MGRKLYRVPLDFNYPLDKVWEGYINPYWQQSTKCAACGGSALNPASRLISETFYAHDQRVIKEILATIEPSLEVLGLVSAMRAKPSDWLPWCDKITQDEVEELVKHHRLMDWTHTCNAVPGEGWKPKDPPYMPTAEEINAANARGAKNFMRSHDGINRFILIEFRAKKYNVWGKCPHCDEDGRIWPEGVKAKYEAWEDYEPPTGEGYQLWENTSEGSPQSPVFATLDELCTWCATNATVFAGMKTTAEQWRQMLDAGFVAHTERAADGTIVSFS